MATVKPERVFVRTSERTLFTKCRQAWWWSYKEQRVPIDKWAPALIFGDMVHRSLAAYYIPETTKRRKRGPHPAKTFQKIFDTMDAAHKTFGIRADDEKWVAMEDLGVEMLENYVTMWKEEDRDYLVLYPEMPFQLDIFDPDTGKYLCTYVGTSDCLVKRLSTGKIGLLEHKTAATINTSHLFIDEQAGTYWALVPEWLIRNEIFRNPIEFDFMLYNYLRKAQADDRPKNEKGQSLNLPTRGDLLTAAEGRLLIPEDVPKGKLTKEYLASLLEDEGLDPALFGQPSKTQPAPLFHREVVLRGEAERTNTMTRIVQHVRDMNKVRAGHPDFPHYKQPNRDCGFCDWKDLCELHEAGDDWKELRRYTTKKWEPYVDHVWSLSLD